ncbi:MAG: DUF1801 domain-containing protein [Candidatus Kapabacteria bacterium]|nr:DUF1801 domain-containing protein [Candidatus Kapabacteria bacterium]
MATEKKPTGTKPSAKKTAAKKSATQSTATKKKVTKTVAANKTQKTVQSVEGFIAKIDNAATQADCRTLAAMMQDISGHPPVMWGTSMVGFGEYTYKYESGREGRWFEIGFSPRKQNLTLYLMCSLGHLSKELAELGKHTTGKSCIYIKSLSDVSLPALEQLLVAAVRIIRTTKV